MSRFARRAARGSGAPPEGHGAADSAGVAWRGRTLAPNPFAADDGSADPAVADAIERRAVHGLVTAMASARLFAPVTAVAGGSDAADMALPTLRGGDGRLALPAFSSVAALVAWDAGARPVPAPARALALSAVADGHQLLVVDAGTADLVVPRPAVWALAQGTAWTPSPQDPEVSAAIEAAAASVPGVDSLRCSPGRRAELAVHLSLVPRLTSTEVEQVARAVSEALASLTIVAERVDSLELVLTEAAAR